MISLGKHKFLVPVPSAMRTFALQQRIIPVAGRVASVLIHLTGAGAIGKLMESDVASILPLAMPHIGAVFSEMPPGELETLTKELLRDTKFGDNDPVHPLFGSPGGDAFDLVMQGRTMDVWRLLWHALEVWYPDFFTSVRARVARTDLKASPLSASTTSPTDGHVSA